MPYRHRTATSLPNRRALVGSLALSLLAAVLLAACGGGDAVQGPTEAGEAAALTPAASQSMGQKPVSMTKSMVQGPFDPIEGAEATVTLTRRANDTFHWKLRASGMKKGHAFTVWILHSDESGGHAAGGLVGGNGKVTAAGNHCVSDLKITEDFPEGFGFSPGISTPDCDVIDTNADLTFAFLDHGLWEPGDMFERWKPFSFSFMVVTFPAP